MIVYVESNFVLEIAFLREEHAGCATLLELAESGHIDLTLPAFCIGEPYEVWVRRSKGRRELHEKLTTKMQELSRSRPYRESSEELRRLTSFLIKSGEEEKRRLDEALTRILNHAALIPIGLNTITRAIGLQKARSLSPQDSIVYASVLHHLETASPGAKCFITKDSRDFLNPDIESDLTTYDCKLLTRFNDALGYVRSCL
jgi:predicted nucleic acid-binding protein